MSKRKRPGDLGDVGTVALGPRSCRPGSFAGYGRLRSPKDPKSLSTIRRTTTKRNKQVAYTFKEHWDALHIFCDEYHQWSALYRLIDQHRLGSGIVESAKHESPKKRKTSDERQEIVYATEDLSWKDLEKLRSLAKLKQYLPCALTLKQWSEENTKDLFALGITETIAGVHVCALNWIAEIFKSSKLSSRHVESSMSGDIRPTTLLRGDYDYSRGVRSTEPPPTRPPPVQPINLTSLIVCWTVDYAKLPRMTLGGWQIVHPDINQASSSNYHINTAYIGGETSYDINTNCKTDLEVLNGVHTALRDGTTLTTNLLADLGCYDSLLPGFCGCFLCDGFSLRPTCPSYNLQRGDVSVRIFQPFLLTANIREKFPNTILDVKLHQLRLDWMLHGRKCIWNNLMNCVYLSFVSTKNDLPLWFERHSKFMYKFRAHIRATWTEFKKGSFKLSGKEVKKLMIRYTELFPLLSQRSELLPMVENIIELFDMIAQPYQNKNLGKYIDDLKVLSDSITLDWVYIFGLNSYLGKQYLHGLSHIHVTERFYLQNRKPTLEYFTMQNTIQLQKLRNVVAKA
jgi:hypothetical protein